MILYFADRQMQILGQATTSLREGYVIDEDLKVEEVETGIATFSCEIGFNGENRAKLEEMTNAGNYLLRKNGDEDEFYTIIDTDIDTKNKYIRIYAEDAGLDLLNEIVDDFEADDSYTSEWYINKYINDSGFEIGINEIPETSKRKLAWEGESTVTARIASIATQFGNYEVSYTFAIKGLEITNKYVNIHEKRGKDDGVQLRLNKEIDRIVTSKTVANLATAFVCEGGVPDDAEKPITLKGYKVEGEDAADFYIDDNGILKAKTANQKWSRYVWNKEPNRQNDGEGYIVRPYSYNTTDQKTLCSHAITELKKLCDMEVNFEVDITRLPEGVKIGDRINIIDDAGGLYLSTRILMLETSVVDQKHTATLGEHLIKKSGINQKVADLAAEFAKNAQSAAKALAVAQTAKTNAEEARKNAAAASAEATNAMTKAEEAKSAASVATESVADAQAKALAAQAAVQKVEASVQSLETTVTEAKAAADNAHQAAQTASTKADEAKTAAGNAQTKADEAKTEAGNAKTSAESAISNAAEAKEIANQSKEAANAAITTARAAKLDAEQAERDVAEWADNLETITDTMRAEYARKTDLTETTAELESKIARNAAGLSSSVSLLQTIDETANDAREKANEATEKYNAAQDKSYAAWSAAQAAIKAAEEAAQAATDAQTEADTARVAADTAQSVADEAAEDLATAKANLATISARADATEEEIAVAQAALNSAQEAANNAKANADAAAEIAATAQDTANAAAVNAWKAKAEADSAQADSDITSALVKKYKEEKNTAEAEATAAETKASQAVTAAEQAQLAADEANAAASTAVQTAEAAQSVADQAATDATNAQRAAEIADSQVGQANENLAKAQERLAKVLANVDSTTEEVEAAQADVEAAQTAATNARTEADAAQIAATEAQTAAEEAQSAAEAAKLAAESAQAEADAAQDKANEARMVVDGLAVRVTKAETNITQKARELGLRVSEVEDETTANGKRITTAESQIQMLVDSISMLVRGEGGGSLIKQDANGAYWFDVSSIINDLDEATDNVDLLKLTAKELEARTEYVKSYTDENGNPCIQLGEGDSEFKVYITNKEIRFEEGTAAPAKINRQMLIIEKAMVKSELQFGDDESEGITGVWIWKRRSNGNLGLTWKGVNE